MPGAAPPHQGDQDKVQDALRAAAGAMEGGHWGVMRALMSAHDTDKLGPYFLPAVSQQGKLGDLEKLIELIEDVGCSDPEYVLSQLSSAMVSAALTGNADMLLALQKVRDEHAAAAAARAGAGAGGKAGAGEGAEEGEGDTTEL